MDRTLMRLMIDIRCGKWDWLCSCMDIDQFQTLHSATAGMSVEEATEWFALVCKICAADGKKSSPDPDKGDSDGDKTPSAPAKGAECDKIFRDEFCSVEGMKALKNATTGLDVLLLMPWVGGIASPQVIAMKMVKSRIEWIRDTCATGMSSEEDGTKMCETARSIAKWGGKMPDFMKGAMSNFAVLIAASDKYATRCCGPVKTSTGDTEFDKAMKTLSEMTVPGSKTKGPGV